MKISAAIITLNEERNIARAMESLRCCEEIVVVDSGSTDRTCDIAANLGARVVEHSWAGYASQKNFAASVCEHDWVLSIDADEALSRFVTDSRPNLVGGRSVSLKKRSTRRLMCIFASPNHLEQIYNIVDRQNPTCLGKILC